MENRETPEALANTSLWTRVPFIILIAYSTRLVSTGIHELIGHGLWAWIFGAKRVWFHVSLLGFGWCKWSPPLSGFPRVIAIAGGLTNTFTIGTAILAFLYSKPNEGGIYMRLPLFWLGSWTTMTQAGYLLLGGLTGYGDLGQLHYLTGIPLSFFVFLGFSLFFLVYLATSTLFISEISNLFPEYRPKTLLLEFWLTMPIQVTLFAISSEHTISLEFLLLLLTLSVIPSLLSLLFFQLFNRLSSKMCT